MCLIIEGGGGGGGQPLLALKYVHFFIRYLSIMFL